MLRSLLTLCCAMMFAQVSPSLAAERGEPWQRHTIDNSSRGADGARLADVNGDGLPDIATGWENGGVVRICLHPGEKRVRQPWPSVTVGNVRKAEDAVFIDINGDGVLDVVSCCEGSTKTMYFHLAPTDAADYLDPNAWRTEPLAPSANRAMWMFCLPLQVDGQHGVDLIAAAKGPGAEVGWFQAPAQPTDLKAWTWHPMLKASWIMSLIPADVDGDGTTDVIVSDRRGGKKSGVYWLARSTSSATDPWHKNLIGGADQQVMFIDYADLDSDGLTDVVAAVSGGDLLYMRREPSPPAAASPKPKWTTHTIPAPPNCGTGKSAKVGDINLDGQADLVYSCENANGEKSGLVWLQCEGSPTAGKWSTHEISGPEGVKFDLLQLVDLDGDGDLDVITCEERDNLGLIWYENPQ